MSDQAVQPDFDRFFVRYADAYNRSLEGEVQDMAIREHFAPVFIAAGPQGVNSGPNDDSFSATLKEAYAFYRKLGTRRMTVRQVKTLPLDATHYVCRVYWRADYVKRDDTPVTIDFEVTYMLETTSGQPKIFAFVAGDELAMYREHGLL